VVQGKNAASLSEVSVAASEKQGTDGLVRTVLTSPGGVLLSSSEEAKRQSSEFTPAAWIFSRVRSGPCSLDVARCP
jgi:hypothetical protein